jgi:hypothetical protein
MPRGGRRTGTPGAQYSNRSDLQQGTRPMPVSTMTGQQYGQAAAQAAAQKAVPMAGTPLPPMPPGPPGAPPQTGAPAPDSNQPPAAPSLTPADVPSLADPSARPTEHVMSGAPIGPGDTPPPPYVSARDFLQQSLQTQAASNTSVAYLLAQMQQRGL